MGAGMSAVRRASSSPFYRVGGGVGGQAVAVVHHNGMKATVLEGNRSGWWWGVMRSRCSGRYGTGGGVRA
jgi:NO-binding membrane sensor protein with MHYT domain